MNAQQNFITAADGVRLSVWDYGGDGPPLVLAHCTGTLARVWDPVVQALTGRYRIIAPDTRGQGDSGVPVARDDFAWHLSGRDLLSVLDALEITKPVFAAGHSAGAAHVVYAALAAPERFARMALIDGIIGPSEFFPVPIPLAELVRRRVNIFSDPAEAQARFAAKPPMNTWRPEALDAYVAHALREREDGQWELKCPGEREAIFYELGGASDLYERLHEIRPPALVLTGADSYISTLAGMQHERIPGSAFEVMRDAGHFIPQEQPMAVANALEEWFQP